MESYESVFRAFADQDIQFLIVGGLAVNLHGHPRFTNDIDILIALDPDNAKKVAEIMQKMGYQQRLPISIEDLTDEGAARQFIEEKGLTAYSFIHAQEPQFNVDVLVGESLNFQQYRAEIMHAKIWNIDLPVISIDDLIEMKRKSGRDKDVQDIEALLELKGL